MIALTVKHLEGAAGVLLPAEAIERLRLQVGDTLIPEEDGAGYRLMVPDADFNDQMAQAEAIMGEDRAVLQRLAK